MHVQVLVLVRLYVALLSPLTSRVPTSHDLLPQVSYHLGDVYG